MTPLSRLEAGAKLLRLETDPRPNWIEKIAEQGLVYNETTLPSGEKMSYWNEDHYYSFTHDEASLLEVAAEELLKMCIEAGDYIIENDLWHRVGIPHKAVPAIKKSWGEEPPSIYGRFDFYFDGEKVKLYEFNADTPVALVEAAVVQWYWHQDQFPLLDQFNGIHEELIAAWARQFEPGDHVHFCHTVADKEGEELMTVAYLAETAGQAKLRTHTSPMELLRYTPEGGFLDHEGRPIKDCYKLYPWEYMLQEEFGDGALTSDTRWIEPAYKMMWSSKGILPILWELYPGHDLLLPAYLERDRKASFQSWVSKPVWGHEGMRVRLYKDGLLKEENDVPTPIQEGNVLQEACFAPDFDGWHPVMGVWVVDGEPSGLGIRESRSLITDYYCRFAPHVID